MDVLLAILIGILYSAGAYLVLRRSVVRFIIGLVILSNATNLLIFLSGGLVEGKPAFVDESGYLVFLTDPSPQALILTAIVIGFGIVVFTLALYAKFYKVSGSDDIDDLKQTDTPEA